MVDAIQQSLLEQVAGLHEIPAGAYNIRANGQMAGRNTTANIDIITKEDRSGIDIRIKAGTKAESVHIPVVLSQSGLKESVYNDFFVGEGADVTIIAGCGIHNGGDSASEHSGIHRFFVDRDAKVRYVEKHYGSGDGNGERIMNPTTEIHLAQGASLEMDTVQIKGIDSTKRVTTAKVAQGASLVIREKIMTHGRQYAETDFKVEMNGEDSSVNLISRSVAKEHSRQLFKSRIIGNQKCQGHSECDAIIMDEASVSAVPELTANNIDASLIHEAAIGKIAGEQLMKLMTLGLTEKEAEEQLVNG
ncbi:MAG: SufD family Fe-S cluster assembly protein, partial [Lachnospiraceae bacterium]|nr:SufD family Fe-S cluster assembly protein [Lachnospiraceae bacterium]